MTKCRGTHTRAFSLLELVIAVAIIAIIAAIGIPRLSRGTKGAADSALSGNLAMLRNAIDIYAAEHTGIYPTADDISDPIKPAAAPIRVNVIDKPNAKVIENKAAFLRLPCE